MKTTSALALLASLPFLASAHFTLDYPPTRGFDEDLEPQFCGGFSSPSSSRTPFPLSGSAPVLIDSHHPSADVAVLLSFNENPTSFADFNQTSSGQEYGFLSGFGTITNSGEFCFNVDVASLGVDGIENGTVATLQVEFNGGDGVLLQCADLILVTPDLYTAPSNLTCSNATSSAATSPLSSAPASVTATGSAGAPTADAAGGSSGAVSGKTVVGGLVGAAAALAGFAATW
ncbi:hypothetical protein JCM11641_000592 [Rhodosporidiobolus odoratus]